MVIISGVPIFRIFTVMSKCGFWPVVPKDFEISQLEFAEMMEVTLIFCCK